MITESNWSVYDDKKIPKIHITEKTWKSIITFQPFIVIGSQNHLKKLREWGFKTFEPFIDETYDEMIAYEDRKRKIYSEIKRLIRMSREELDLWYWNMIDICLFYNFLHI